MLTTFTNHKALFSLREISPRSKRMRCFHYVCMLLSLILSLGNVRWRVLLMCFATIALMFLSTECVASSISRWLGCKAEYYLLSCSTHSVLRLQRLGWMEDIRRSFFKRWQHKCTALHTAAIIQKYVCLESSLKANHSKKWIDIISCKDEHG